MVSKRSLFSDIWFFSGLAVKLQNILLAWLSVGSRWLAVEGSVRRPVRFVLVVQTYLPHRSTLQSRPMIVTITPLTRGTTVSILAVARFIGECMQKAFK